MGEGNEWHVRAIAEFFESSCPGEWGTDGTREAGTPVLRSTNFCNDGSIDYSDIAYRSVPEKRLDLRRIGIGTILIEKAGGSSTRPAGRVVYCDREFGGTASNFVEVVQIKAESSAKYVFYLLYHNFHSGLVYKYQQQTTGIINFKLREYSAEIVDTPDSYAEQSKIAEVLSTVDRAIAQTEALIAKQQRIKTGLMQDLLTRGIDEHGQLRTESTHRFKDSPLGRIPVEWTVVRLGDVADISSGITLGKSYSGPNTTELPYLRVANVQDGFLDLSEIKTIRIPTTQVEKYCLRNGDVLMNEGGDFDKLGRGTIWRGEIALCLHQNHVFKVRPMKDRLLPDFLAYVSSSPIGKAYFVLASKQSTNLASINSTQLKAFAIPLPSYSEQLRFQEVTRQVDETIKVYQDKLAKLRLTKTALMQDLLTGKVRVTPLLEQAEAATA